MGIRNSLIENFNRLEIRNDAGSLWENFCIAERIKFNAYLQKYANAYFWRTYEQKEIDYVEEMDGKITGFEFKLNAKPQYSPPAEFIKNYQATVEKIDKNNYWKFLTQ